MAKKNYSFCVEKIYRTKVEGEFDIDEIRQNNKHIAHWRDEEILIRMAENSALFDEGYNADAQYDLEETNVRTIFDETDKEIVYED